MVDLSRREFLRRTGTLAAAGMLGPRAAEALYEPGTLRPVSMAMHIHASFSEGQGSMESQLAQAQANAVDVLWWTDHDWRMSAHGYRRAVYFSAMTEKENGLPLTWVPRRSGTLTSYSGAIVSSPASPSDPTGPSSLRVTAVARGTAFAFNRYSADSTGARYNLKGSLAGQQITLEVYPGAVNRDAFLEVRIVTSTHPARAGRPAGYYTLSYRIGGPQAAGTRSVSGLTGIVACAAPAGRWTTLRLTPVDDIAALWPDLQSRDAGLVEFSVGAASRNGATARGCFDYLRFEYGRGGHQPLVVQRDLMAAYAGAYPEVRQHQGLEVSLDEHHVNAYGGTLSLPDYGTTPLLPAPKDRAATRGRVATIRESGGIASYNHMFGAAGVGSPALPVADQETRRRAVAGELITERVYGADVLEVGYPLRGRVTLDRHLAVWDACSRNGIFATGNGVSDNHTGRDWRAETLNFLTWAWAAGKESADLVAALRSGRCYFGDMRRFAGALDLVVDGACPMGSVSVSELPVRELAVYASGVPSDGSVRLVQGVVDYAGASVPDPSTSVWSYPASEFATGARLVILDTTVSSFVRVEVLDAAGVLVAGSNPVWLLRSAPPDGLPAARAC